MNKIIAIAKWEFLETVKKKSFIIFMILFPIFIAAMGILPTLLADSEQEAPKPIGVLDETGIYFNALAEKLEEHKLDDGQPKFIVRNLTSPSIDAEKEKDSADALVFSGGIDGYIHIRENDEGEVAASYRNKELGNRDAIDQVEWTLNDVVKEKRFRDAGFDPELINELIEWVDLGIIQIKEEGGEEELDFAKIFFTSYAFIMLLMLMIVFTGGLLVRSLIEEKSNRIIEILLSSCTSQELLMGKFMGLCVLGLFQITIWSLVGIAAVGSNLVMMDVFNNVGIQLVYFVMGYIFFTSIFVGIGSVVNSEQEAQQFTSYISIILVLPMVLAIQVIQNPSSVIAQVLSYIPITTAPVMILRINVTPPPLWEILLTLAIMVVSIYLVITVTARIFRIGILAYGTKPTLKELKQWVLKG